MSLPEDVHLRTHSIEYNIHIYRYEVKKNHLPFVMRRHVDQSLSAWYPLMNSTRP